MNVTEITTRILADAIGAACVIAMPFMLLYIAYGFGGVQ